MEVKFNQNTLSCLQMVVSGVQKLEQTLELRLPEGYPDIGRILGCWGQVLLRGKEWRSSGMSANAGVMAWVLYAPEDGSSPRVVDAWIPFSCKWDFPEPVDDGLMTMQPLLTDLDGRGTSARKIMLRACVDMMGQAMIPSKAQIPVPDTLPEDVYLRRESYPVELPMEGGEKQMQMERLLNLPDTPGSHKVISASLKPQVQEQKLVANRLIFRGEATLHLRYIHEDGSLGTWQTQIPFSQYVELDRDYGAQASAWLEPVVTALELTAEDNGQMSMKAGVAAQYLIFDRSVLEMVTDAYSPCREVGVQEGVLTLPMLLDMRTVDVNVQGTTEELGSPGDIAPMPAYPALRQGDDGTDIRMDGHCQILARDGEGQLRMESVPFTGSVPFPSAAENRTQLWVGPGSVPTLSPGAGGSVIQCGYPVTAMVYSGQPISVVVGLELGELKPLDPDRPSIILRRAGEEDLWTMAKCCGSTVEAIQKANQLQQEPEKGQMLLIPVC